MLAGVAVALAGNRLIANLLFQVKASDSPTLAAVCACIVVAALGASCLPAVRVSHLARCLLFGKIKAANLCHSGFSATTRNCLPKNRHTNGIER